MFAANCLPRALQMKPKNRQQTKQQQMIHSLLLLVSGSVLILILIITYIAFRVNVHRIALELDTSYVFYLAGISSYGSIEFIFRFTGIASVICLGMIVFYFLKLRNPYKRRSKVFKLTVFMLLFVDMMILKPTNHFIWSQFSYISDQSMYRLFREESMGDISYVVLKCDLEGNSCSFYARPFTRNSQCFNPNGTSLKKDPESDQFMLENPDGFGQEIKFGEGDVFSGNINGGCR
jgi:hypothetical protein